jgi:hypothetical protein
MNGLGLTFPAAARVLADGSVVTSTGFSGTGKPAAGTYEFTLTDGIGVSEVLIYASEYGDPGVRVVIAADLDPDEVTITVRTYDTSGVLTDAGVSLLVGRISL